MKAKIGILASKAIVSQASNSASLTEIIEELQVGNFPAGPIPDDAVIQTDYTFMAVFEATEDSEKIDEDIPATFWIETPSGRRAETTTPLNLKGTPKCRAMVQVLGLPYSGAGTYVFNMEFRGAVASWDILVTVV